MEQFFTLVLLFTIYSFIGWLSESIYCSILEKRLINRGFLNGPVCPVYGFGALLVLFVLTGLRDHLLLLFLTAVVLTSALEYVTALALEKTFHAKYWDYSGQPFNIRGRVCLKNSLMFGGMSVLAVTVIHPTLIALIVRLLPAVQAVLATLLLCAYALDTALSTNAMHGLNGKLDELQAILDEKKELIRAATEEKKEALQSSFLEHLEEVTNGRLRMVYESRPEIKFSFRPIQRRLIRAFPHMESLRNKESLQRVREIIRAVPSPKSLKNKQHGCKG